MVVFLGYFVRYAWENNWVGPTGRVLSGAVFSLGLVAAGLRLMRREYRPLAQGLAAAGLAGLYVTAFAAHSVYGLVPRTASAAFMFVVTASAVVLAERLDARLLAALAWIGGYLAPVLLSTGEDKAVSLFGYLLLLGAGAVWLDRRRPWPETLPLALAGTALLYVGWYAAHFRPERFGVAIAGLLVLSALFALGAAEKERPAWLAILAVVAAIGLAALGQDANRPEVVLPVSLLLAGALLRAPGLRLAGVVAAPLVVAVPFLAWTAAHYRPESFGIAAGWVAGGSLLVALASPAAMAPAPLMPAIALVGGGLASIGLAGSSDRPLGILGLLAAQAGLAVLASRRFAWAEAAGSVLAAAAVLAWLDRFFARDRGTEALALGLAVAALYFLVVAVRGFLGEKLGAPGTVTHVAAAGLAWAVLYRVLDLTSPSLLGPSAAAAGALHLAVGLAARQRGGDPLRVRVTLGLAAAFLTIAIPVQLGLHGITVGWALEGLLLLWLGVREPLVARAGVRLRRPGAGRRPSARPAPAAAPRRVQPGPEPGLRHVARPHPRARRGPVRRAGGRRPTGRRRRRRGARRSRARAARRGAALRSPHGRDERRRSSMPRAPPSPSTTRPPLSRPAARATSPCRSSGRCSPRAFWPRASARGAVASSTRRTRSSR